MSTVVKEIKLHLSRFDSIQAARLHVEEIDQNKTFLVLSGLNEIQDDFWVALIERWTHQFPGRIFVECDFREEKNRIGNIIRQRLPAAKPKLCWAGKLFYGEERWTDIEILNPINPDRLPISEELHIICPLSDAQLKNIPLSSVRPPCCIVQDTFVEFDRMLVISPAVDRSDCRLFLMALGRSKREIDGQEYVLHPIQSPLLFSQMYMSAMEKPKRGQVLDKPFMLRTQAVGTELLLKSVDQQSLGIIQTRKQLDVMKAVAAMEEKFVPFFQNLKGVKSKETEMQDSVTKTNFESVVANKRINKLKGNWTQSDVNAILKQLSEESGSVGESIYSGKRMRRLLGTSYNSHKWPLPSVISRDQLVAGPLFSEVIGELLQ